MLFGWWREQAGEKGTLAATSLLLRNLWTFLRESTPEQQRQRFGDMEYDWEYRVNTTSGTVGWRARLLGLFYSPYQPTDPALFREMMASLPILSEQFAFEQFTFVDLGSGKGRTLLMASEYPFRKIVGVELLPELHRVAQENLAGYKSDSQKCFALEAVLGDASSFSLPDDPLVLYLFNPLPERALSEVVQRLGKSLAEAPRPLWIVYHNPQLESTVSASGFLEKAGGTPQYSVYRQAGGSSSA